MLSFVKDIDYLAGGISDHCPLSLNLNFSAERGMGGWWLSPGWLQNEQVSSQERESIASYWSNNEDSADPLVV